MELRVTPMSQSLERKIKFLGFEIIDLFFLFFVLSALDLTVGAFLNKLLFVWGPVVVIATILRLAKIGKPERFLEHFIKFHVTPRYQCCFLEDPKLKAFSKKTWGQGK